MAEDRSGFDVRLHPDDEGRVLTPPRWYEPRLDALRLFAFLFVFISHNLDVSTFAPSWLRARLGPVVTFGLVLFFVLSAFLLTRLIALEIGERGSFSARRYFQRRILRIWPLYFVILGAAVLATALLSMVAGLASSLGFAPENVLPLGEVPSFVFFFANWYLPLTHSPGNFLPHLWSLSVEEQFYLALPVLFAIAVRRRHTLLVLAVVGVLVTCVLLAADASTRLVGSATTSYLICFAAGMALARSETRVRGVMRHARSRWTVALVAVGVWVAYAVLLPTMSRVFGDWQLLLDVIIQTGLVAAAIAFVVTLASPRHTTVGGAMQWLGKRSYGLYVFHWPVLQLVAKSPVLSSGPRVTAAGVIASLLVTVGVATFSYRFLELPFLTWRRRLQIA